MGEKVERITFTGVGRKKKLRMEGKGERKGQKMLG